MGLYNFQPRFVPFILSGAKTHTIRAIRVHPDVPGNTLYLYTGLRTRAAKPLMKVKCVKVENIVIDMQPSKGKGVLARGLLFPHIAVDGIDLGLDELYDFARRDGFKDWPDMVAFWTTPKNRLPFQGHIIHWRKED